MKRVMTSVLAACMALSMAACASKTDPSGSSASSDESSAATSAESSASASESEKVNTNVEPKDIEAAIATKLGSDYLATVEVSADDLYLTPLADLDMSKIESYIVKLIKEIIMNLMKASHQVVIVQLKPKELIKS